MPTFFSSMYIIPYPQDCLMHICPFLSFWWLSVDLAVHHMETRKLRGIHFNWWLPLEKDKGLNCQEISCCSACCTSWTHFCWEWLVTISDVFLPQNPGLFRASFLYIVLDPCCTLVKNYFLSMIVKWGYYGCHMDVCAWSKSRWYLHIFFLHPTLTFPQF